MKNKELIKILKDAPEDAEVFIYIKEENRYISNLIIGETFDNRIIIGEN